MRLTDGGPQVALQATLVRLERELATWLQQPVEVLMYFLASQASSSLPQVLHGWNWMPPHQQVWADLHALVAPGDAPVGIRALPLAEASLANVVSRRLAPALPELFRLLEPDTARARRVVQRVERGAELLHRSVGELLSDATPAFDQLRRIAMSSSKRTENWQRDAAVLLDRFSATLPESLYEREKAWLEQLRDAVATYQAPLKQPPPQTPYSDPASLEFQLGHFLNNWD